MLRYLKRNQPTRSPTETPQPLQVDDEERPPTSIVETPQPQLIQLNNEERPPTLIAERPSSSIAETPQLVQVHDEERPTSLETNRRDKRNAEVKSRYEETKRHRKFPQGWKKILSVGNSYKR